MSPADGELRKLPAVDRVIDALAESGPPQLVARAARTAVDRWRARIADGDPAPQLDAVVETARALFSEERGSLLRPVINATGVLIHTNLGRAPLGRAQLDAVDAIAGGYSNLEYDLGEGRRGSRYSHARQLLTALTGAESALVVNNNAAATLIVLAAHCAGREVIVSRGELIEIGGEFRIPDVMAASGAILREVGTTNRTHLQDYERAISPETAAILKVHPSNYRVLGFTAAVPARDLAKLGRGRRVLFVHDLGSGLVDPAGDAIALHGEPVVADALSDGADLVTFSGDKLLGGPQAGVILGRSKLIDRIAAHPLMRAVRVDKMTLAALEATLSVYLEGRAHELPLWKMATAQGPELEARATRIASALSGPVVKAEAKPSRAVAGGGSLPGTELGSWAVTVVHSELSADDVAARLRRCDPPIVARIDDGSVVLDLRTIDPGQDELVVRLVAGALR